MTCLLFRHRNMSDFYCVVPEHKPLPPFVQGQGWECVGFMSDSAPPPEGFREEVARFAIAFQGFYAFRDTHVLMRRHAQQAAGAG